MGKRNRRARRGAEKQKIEGDTNKSKKGEDQKSANHADDSAHVLTTDYGPSPAASSSRSASNASQDRAKGPNWMRPLLTIWQIIARGFRALIDFLDGNSGALTAIATIAIAILTCKYVTYSKKQWEVMTGQLRYMESQTHAWVGLSIDGISTDEPLRVRGDSAVAATCYIAAQNFGSYPAQNVFGYC